MPRKSKAQQAREDEAYLRSMQTDLPLPPEPSERRGLYLATVPEKCPTCNKDMTFASGWALVFGDMLQCGGCSQLITVPRTAYEKYAKGLHDHFDRLKSRPVARPKRERGAR